MTTPSETFDALAEAAWDAPDISRAYKLLNLGFWAMQNRALISRALKAVEWLPVESAPKDGTHVLLRYRWAHRDVYVAEGWWSHDMWVCHGNLGARAFAWLPLPTPPVKDSDHGK
jgi:hypothetical protein